MSISSHKRLRDKQDGTTSKVRKLTAWSDLDGTKGHNREQTLPLIDIPLSSKIRMHLSVLACEQYTQARDGKERTVDVVKSRGTSEEIRKRLEKAG